MINKKIDLKTSCFIIDSSVLIEMFEGKNKGHSNDLLMKLKELKDNKQEVKVVTTLSSFLRAIFLADSNVNINKIQKTLTFLKIAPDFIDFKNEEEVREEIIRFAGVISGGKNKK